ncbi:hypothetical protein RIF29_18676 [Crotalaria pallida]|uniref:mitogen-activated protein kinase kinase n=1 Tax=Crotalaria pallida TaxID=3830 RepID=A0AAN9EYL5_CROPI
MYCIRFRSHDRFHVLPCISEPAKTKHHQLHYESKLYMLLQGGNHGVYNINELGLQKCTSDESDHSEKTYNCASNEMRIFGAIGSGASSVVQRTIHIPTHRILALKKINIFEKEKRQQLLTEIRTLCKAPCYGGLVEFHGAFYTVDSGQISIALEYMDGGSLADILRKH